MGKAVRYTTAGDGVTVVGYGHLGDGNLHLNISVPKLDDKVGGCDDVDMSSP